LRVHMHGFGPHRLTRARAQSSSSYLWTLGRVGKLIETLTSQHIPSPAYGGCSSGWRNGRPRAGRRLKRMTRPVCNSEIHRACWSASTYPFRLSGTTFVTRLPTRRLDRYAICFSPPQIACVSGAVAGRYLVISSVALTRTNSAHLPVAIASVRSAASPNSQTLPDRPSVNVLPGSAGKRPDEASRPAIDAKVSVPSRPHCSELCSTRRQCVNLKTPTDRYQYFRNKDNTAITFSAGSRRPCA
jgi:hypothetical protein